MPNQSAVLLIGLGKIGLPVAQALLQQGKTVIGVSRHAPILSANLNKLANFYHIQANANQLTSKQLAPFSEQITQICIIVSPDQSTIQAYHDTYLAICQNIVTLSNGLVNLQRVVFISSTSIYGQHQGEVIDINTPILPPQSATAQILYQAEQTLQQPFGKQCTIIRPSGIYGKGRLRLINMVKNIANNRIEPPQNTWTNRIFDTDLTHIIVQVLTILNPLPIYIATDNQPVPMYKILSWLTDELNLTLNLPTVEAKQGKRLRHNLPNDWLKVDTYKKGYQRVLQDLA